MELPLSRHLLIGSLSLALLAGTASADTLREALVSTYATNPTITAQRQLLRSTDANVAIARAAGRPTVGGTVAGQPRPDPGRCIPAPGGRGRSSRRGGSKLSNLQRRIGTQLDRGGRVRVDAGRATLRAVEGDVFTEPLLPTWT
jgi:outer membrane protein